jgi:predicted metal-binding membrane protein
MTETTSYNFSHLEPVEAGLGRMLSRPKAVAAGCVIVVAGLGWLFVALLTVTPDISWLAVTQALCRTLPEGAWNLPAMSVVLSMWSVMTLAMMVPSAAPMILTYAEIAETAARKSERIVSPLVIAAGYASVWLVFSVAATAMQIALARAALFDPDATSTGGFFAALTLIGAGLYQFSALKHACLVRCQHPFSFFFANWATTRRGVFRLGVRQGLYCLGCCWAMMMVMFAVGVMNIAWMAGLAVVMTVEKLQTGRRFAQAAGVALITIGLCVAASALAAQLH